MPIGLRICKAIRPPMHSRPTHPEASTATRQPWTILVLLAVAQFMVILDITVVNVALPSISRDLSFAAGDLQWVVTAYVLLSGGLLLLGGRIADMLGRRSVFLAGLALFTAASLTSGLAQSPGMLIASRAAQGLGAAMLSPGALSLVTATYAGAQRTRALSTWGGIAAAGSVIGMVIGGMLTAWLSWRWVFFINVPIGLVTLPLVRHLVPASPGTGGLRSLDGAGAVVLVGGLVALVYGIEGTSTHGWGSARTLGVFAASALLLASFIAIERVASRPLVPLSTWRNRSLSSGVALMFGATAFMVGLIYLSSLFMQGSLGMSALEAGLAFVPLSITIGVVAHLAPQVLRAVGTKAALGTALLVAAGGGVLLAGAPADALYVTDLLPGFILTGIGLGLGFVTIQVAAMSDVSDANAGLASGVFTTGHEIGAAFGVAALSAIAGGTGSGAVERLGSVAGFGDGITAAALAAAVMAGLAAFAIPSIRPPATAHVGLH
jgi:EmrB/QacA subfamily drug resistance transporter